MKTQKELKYWMSSADSQIALAKGVLETPGLENFPKRQ